MNRLIIAVTLLLAGCAAAPVLPPDATPAQVAAAKAAQREANFTAVCKYAAGGWQIAKPIASVPAVKAKIGASGVLAVQALDAFVTTTCSQPLDITNADAVIQRGYDIAGEVIALVIQAEAQ